MNYFRRISVNDADNILATRPNALLLDIRNERDFIEQHHPKAELLTESLLRKIIRTGDKSAPIVVYCYHGNTSQDIARLFCDFGFKECYSVDGGYASWRHQNEHTFPRPRTLQRWLEKNGITGQDVNARLDDQFRTPLMLAAKSGNHQRVDDLIEAGADPNLKDIHGNNALWYACLGQNTLCVRLIINADVEVDNENVHGFTALNYAVGLDDIFSILQNYFRDESLLRLSYQSKAINRHQHYERPQRAAS